MPTKIAILGAESSGKTTLTEELAVYYDGDAVFEYAREYMTTSEVTYEEVEHIAHEQFIRENFVLNNSQSKYIFFDTEMINLQVWFREVYGQMPAWLEQLDIRERYDYYLITENDLPWVDDPIRSASDLNERNRLRDIYIAEVDKLQLPYSIISGSEEERLSAAIQSIDKWSAE